MNAITKVGKVVDKVDGKETVPPEKKPAAAAPDDIERPRRKRRFVQRFRFVLMLILPLALLAGGIWWWVTGGRYQSTEDAYLKQPKISIASEVSGRVVTVPVSNNQTVKAGDVLFQVDPEPFRIAVSEDDAAIASARLKVEQLKSAYSQAVAAEKAAAEEATFYSTEFERQSKLARTGISAQATLDQAHHNLDKAHMQLVIARQGIASARAALDGNPDLPVDQHPLVMAALAARQKDAYDLKHTTVKAPAAGIVYQAASFKPGQYVTTGTPLFTLVETGDTWIDANFKETQLDHMRPGQTATITFDTYPEHTFKATVEAIGAGTGEQFSLLPAQNATGNWVKVTQRIPVQLKLKPDEAKLALRTGMSATVSLDTGHVRGFGSLIALAHAAIP